MRRRAFIAALGSMPVVWPRLRGRNDLTGCAALRGLGPGRARVESKRVDEFANMSDEELEAYVNGDRGLEH